MKCQYCSEIVEVQAPCPQLEERLNYLRGQIEDECISYGEIAELQDLASQGLIPGHDLVLKQWAGVPESILIQGRRWFDSINGNTYHSVSVEVDGEVIGVEPFAYGYDDQYQQTALEILIDKGILPKLTYENGIPYGLRRTCETLEINLDTTVRDVRKRDLHKVDFE